MRRVVMAGVLLAASAAWAAPGARYFVRVRGVLEAPGVTSGFTDEARRLFADELKKHAEFTMEWPAGLPDEPQALVAALRKRKLRAFEVTLKIMGVTKDLKPPPEGKPFRQLVRGIRLSVFGNTLPDNVVAIGGDGESTLQSDVNKNADIDKEGAALLGEATKVAVAQAVEMTLTKLNLAARPAKAPPKKKPN